LLFYLLPHLCCQVLPFEDVLKQILQLLFFFPCLCKLFLQGFLYLLGRYSLLFIPYELFMNLFLLIDEIFLKLLILRLKLLDYLTIFLLITHFLLKIITFNFFYLCLPYFLFCCNLCFVFTF